MSDQKRKCSQCEEEKERVDFSKNQWGKGDKARCSTCTAAGADTSSSAATKEAEVTTTQEETEKAVKSADDAPTERADAKAASDAGDDEDGSQEEIAVASVHEATPVASASASTQKKSDATKRRGDDEDEELNENVGYADDVALTYKHGALLGDDGVSQVQNDENDAEAEPIYVVKLASSKASKAALRSANDDVDEEDDDDDAEESEDDEDDESEDDEEVQYVMRDGRLVQTTSAKAIEKHRPVSSAAQLGDEERPYAKERANNFAAIQQRVAERRQRENKKLAEVAAADKIDSATASTDGAADAGAAPALDLESGDGSGAADRADGGASKASSLFRKFSEAVSFTVNTVVSDAKDLYSSLASNATDKSADEHITRPDELGATLPLPDKKAAPARIAVVGTGGRMTDLLFLMFRFRQAQSHVQVVAVCDESEEALRRVRNAVPNTVDAATYTDFDKMLAAEADNVSWLLIGSKNAAHAEQCVKAFDAGLNVFCEKPLAISVRECERVLEAQRRSARTFAIGFVLRYAPVYAAMKKLIDDGELGKLVTVEANELLNPSHGAYIMRNWRRFEAQAGPHILEKCCHDMDILLWLVDSPVRRVASFGGLDVFTAENRPYKSGDAAAAGADTEEEELLRMLYESWPAWEAVDAFDSEKDIVDNQVCIIEFESGVRATFNTNSHSALAQRRLLIVGTKGTAVADLITGKVMFHAVNPTVASREVALAGGGHGGGDAFLIEELLASILFGHAPKVGAEAGYRSAALCLALDDARKKGEVLPVPKLK